MAHLSLPVLSTQTGKNGRQPYCPSCLDKWYSRVTEWRFGIHEKCEAALREIKNG